MVTKDLKRLLQKLNNHMTHALEAAAGFCISRGHYEVTIEHFLLKLLEDGSGDLLRILPHYGVDTGRVWDVLLLDLERFRAGNTGRPTFSPVLLQALESAWIVASVHHGFSEVRSGTFLEALLESDGLRAEPYMDVLNQIQAGDLRQHFVDVVAGSVEDRSAGQATRTARLDGEQRKGETALDLYTLNVTGRARDGKIDPVLGRDKEIRQIIDILSRRRKNNPILVGEAGVGKSAVVEGLALRIANGDVPDSLKDVEIRTLDLGLLQAGAGVKGEFENRLKSVIQEVKEAPKPTILFIDEAHTLIGAGGAAGTSDAANLLKPALARGELRTIAATTWSEYKKYIEKDPALERRFQLVKVDEPSVEVASIMLRGIKSKYEDHHGVTITNEAVRAAAELSSRFISGRQLPDKAVDLLDTSAARVKMTQTARPAQLDDLDRKIQHLELEIAAQQRDMDTGLSRGDEELDTLRQELLVLHSDRALLESRLEREKLLVLKINDVRARLSAPALVPAGGDGSAAGERSVAGDGAPTDAATVTEQADDRGELTDELMRLQAELAEVQGESPMVHAEVNQHIAAQVIADWTGIPVGNMMRNEATTLLELEDRLRTRILGQDEAIEQIAESIRTAKAGLANPDAPLGVFLFVGPSGVGKTETALALADLLFGGDRFVTTINMSEYQEPHTVSQLKGSPPGYVGYGEGGILTEAVRQRAYSVVLLDEVEKAHRDVMNLFYQVFDRGFMRDGEGREINFRNTIILMTSNLASDIITFVSPEGERPTPDQLREAIHDKLIEHFQPALLGRMKVVPYFPLHKETMKGIVKLKLNKIGKRLQSSHKMEFEYEPDVVERIAERCTEVDAGARNADFIIDRTVLPEASRALIAKMMEEEKPSKLKLGIDGDGEFTYTFT
ncbi:MAG TPA: type VI secretion system ATPase TssH [Rhodothermales bacterium]|nr:type VI secretion system ATPase TssH [Rhodothermales bacterium]